MSVKGERSFQDPGSGFRVSGLGVRVPDFGFRVSGFGFQASGSGFLSFSPWLVQHGVSFNDSSPPSQLIINMVSGVGFRDPGCGFRVESGIQDLGNPGPGFRVEDLKVAGEEEAFWISGVKSKIRISGTAVEQIRHN